MGVAVSGLPAYLGTLAGRLDGRLPGLRGAVDERTAARRVDADLLRDAFRVDGLSVRSLWYSEDATCALRYRVTVAGRFEDRAQEVTLLGRVFPETGDVTDYLDRDVGPLVPTGEDACEPWRQWTAAWPTAGLAVHPYPIDPAVPTLPAVVSGRRLDPLLPEGCRGPTLVRHTRTGVCVLRYDAPPGPGPGSLFAKVYGDTAGERAYRYLRFARMQWGTGARSDLVRIPAPVAYEPSLRTLVTDAVPGTPMLPVLLRAAMSADAGATRRLDRAVVAAGRVLSLLHGSDGPTSLPPVMEICTDVRAQLQVVAQVWPEVAAAIESRLADTPVDGRPPDPVWCHGDFTPSQLLFTPSGQCGLVDFDTVSQGDPAADLGRFIAHLDLLASAVSGSLREQPQHVELARSFLGGYAEANPRRVRRDAVPLRQVAAYRTLSLARTALHACRQLKPARLTRALTLLETASTWSREVAR